MADIPQQFPIGFGGARRRRPTTPQNVIRVNDIGVIQRKPAATPPGAVVKMADVGLIRRSVQVACFVLFLLFFFLTTATSQYKLGVPVNLFMGLDFLNTLKNSIG